ncbi:hypothetical protein NGRA_0380 [Nosema granulosis]|uniref:Pyrimidine 5-nucleotidase n=1 Tax=Nosema granulosis TaxID=83296 RepID=A0A9P6H115_9MICR|nr:hypothetical protein NGRA_0380 [Nosema granulosis]
MKYVGMIEDTVDQEVTIIAKNNKILVFDIDNTLYKETMEIVIRRREAGYALLKDELDMSFKEFFKLSDAYTKEYGTNYKGFITNYKLKPETILKINEVDADLGFTPNEELVELIKSLPFTKVCFTNANIGQTRNTLRRIGLEELMDYIFYVKYEPGKNVLCKPYLKAYEVVDTVINKDKKNKILFFDDNSDNIGTANDFGWDGVGVPSYERICEAIAVHVYKYFDYDIREH